MLKKRKEIKQLTLISCSAAFSAAAVAAVISQVLVNAIFVVETLLSLSGMLLAVVRRCADPPAEELPLPLLRLCRSSDGEMGPEELST